MTWKSYLFNQKRVWPTHNSIAIPFLLIPHRVGGNIVSSSEFSHGRWLVVLEGEGDDRMRLWKSNQLVAKAKDCSYRFLGTKKSINILECTDEKRGSFTIWIPPWTTIIAAQDSHSFGTKNPNFLNPAQVVL